MFLHTDCRLGHHGLRGDAEFSEASLVFSCDPEDVSQSLQQTSDIQLSVSDKFPKCQDRTEDSLISFDISHISFFFFIVVSSPVDTCPA